MLNITPKTKRDDLIIEILTLRRNATLHDAEIERLETRQRADAETIRNLEHKAEVLETDVANMLGTIRVMADSARRVRIRASSVQREDIGSALPFRNTDKL